MAKQKYKGRSIGWLLNKTQFYFNRYIRLRDFGKPCISCGCPNFDHASHFFPVRGNPKLRFDEDNVHGGCARCNTFMYGNQFEYGQRLPDRIGKNKFDELLMRKQIADKDTTFKWNRWEVIEILEKYKQKCKDLSGQ